MSLRIGTRGSALALAQAGAVADLLGGGELVEIATAGDRGASGGDKSRWVAELERALLDGEVDVAVHSAKDVPGELADGLVIAAVPARADARDALVGFDSLDAVPPGARVGTSSLRRAAQLRAARDDLDVVAMRGNVDTRLGKLAEGEWDAIVLALAGLERLGRVEADGRSLSVRLAEGRESAACVLDPDAFVPAPGQGALAVEARAGEAAEVAGIDDAVAHARLRAERALTAALDATCHTPVGAHAEPAGAGLALTAFAGLPDGSAWVRDRREGADPEALGREVAERML
ncbi:MAG TPA: hydroxymethylbilane synthase, partial [Solirubrobacteraceae bacterium]|nr:hydroxymethylbilane synthase [Solirubrobacteraceae bacterium]